MRRTALLCVILTFAALQIGVSLYATRGANSDQSPAKRVDLDSNAFLFWPLSRSWVWKVDPVATKRRVGVCVRTVESNIPAGTTPSIPVVSALPPKGKERHSSLEAIRKL